MRMNAPLPLLGKTVAVTRAREQAGGLCRRLTELGARVLECPLIRVERVTELAAIDAAIHGLAGYDWLVLTSGNAVRFFFERLGELGGASPQASTAIAVVGKATGIALERYGCQASLTAPEAVGESLAAALIEAGVGGRRVLFPKARVAREVLPDALRRAGAAVDEVILYDTVPDPAGAAPLLAALAAGELDLLTLASPSTVEHFHALAGLPARPGAYRIVSIGPVTSARAEQLGYKVDGTAGHSGLDGLVEAVVRVASRPAGGG
jgi:uroporphyrinogen III methyltransferase/synthase